MSGITRTHIPFARKLSQPSFTIDAYSQIEKNKVKQKSYSDKRAKRQPSLEPNEGARLRSGKQWIPARVDCPANTRRSYHVTTETGQWHRRDRKDLLKSNGSPPVIIEPHVEDTCVNTVTTPTTSAISTTNQPTTAVLTSPKMATQSQDPPVSPPLHFEDRPGVERNPLNSRTI